MAPGTPTIRTVLDDETITNRQHCRVRSRLCLEPQTGLVDLLAPLKEGRKGDVEPSQYLLFGLFVDRVGTGTRD
jgi:hypothetical protein